jgi:hypothetical protein
VYSLSSTFFCALIKIYLLLCIFSWTGDFLFMPFDRVYIRFFLRPTTDPFFCGGEGVGRLIVRRTLGPLQGIADNYSTRTQ